jgi:hypothetical protein
MRTAVFPLIGMLAAAPAWAAPELSPNPRAEALNDEGKSLYSDRKDFAGAAEKFRQAIAVAPDARYYFNLCSAEAKLDHFDAALEACDEVYNHDPRPDLAEKTGKRTAEIHQRMRALRNGTAVSVTPGGETGGSGGPPGGPSWQPAGQAPPPPNPGGPGGPGGPAPPGGPGAPAGAAPGAETNVSATAEPDPGLNYRWSLGAELGILHNNSVGDAFFNRNGTDLKLHADFLISRRLAVGVQPYLDFSFVGGKPDDTGKSRDLVIGDLGAAIYLHRKLWRSLWVTPLAGVHLSGLNPYGAGGGDSFATFGFRFEGGLAWVFGRGMHVVTFVPVSLNVYLPAAVSNSTASLYGFDHTGTTWGITVGYTIRFQSGPFPGLMLE